MAEFPELSASPGAEGPKPSADYDVFRLMAPYLDPHMLFPVLSFLQELNVCAQYMFSEWQVVAVRIQEKVNVLQIYNAMDTSKAMFTVAKGTKMTDYMISSYEALPEREAHVLAELEDTKNAVDKEWADCDEALQPFAPFFDIASGVPTDLMKELAALEQFEADFLAKHHGVSADTINALYKAGKLRFETGAYENATTLLSYFRELVPEDSPENWKALWGIFAANILSQNWEAADQSRESIRASLNKRTFSELEALQQRSWLLHWSLFVFANMPNDKDGKEALVESFLGDQMLNALQLNCPWLLRYLTASILTSKKRHTHTKLLLRVISQEAASFRDPIIELVEALLLNFDFDGAQAKLAQCEAVIATDYFLSSLTSPAEFMDAARRFIFETYCRIHEKIGLDMLASKLHMPEEDAERWLVDLIRTASLDARIDSAGRQVIMSVPVTSVYQQIVDKTRDLTARTRALADSIESAVPDGEPAPEKALARQGPHKGDGDYRGASDGGRGRGSARVNYGGVVTR